MGRSGHSCRNTRGIRVSTVHLRYTPGRWIVREAAFATFACFKPLTTRRITISSPCPVLNYTATSTKMYLLVYQVPQDNKNPLLTSPICSSRRAIPKIVCVTAFSIDQHDHFFGLFDLDTLGFRAGTTLSGIVLGHSRILRRLLQYLQIVIVRNHGSRCRSGDPDWRRLHTSTVRGYSRHRCISAHLKEFLGLLSSVIFGTFQLIAVNNGEVDLQHLGVIFNAHHAFAAKMKVLEILRIHQ
mmetsp:Transcript_3996/g.9804  ORF Transcript_3996/g.9804 Transcript_3996/m.9804 type:complete len:241 (-) Transcript_3996:1669-2391(-)